MFIPPVKSVESHPKVISALFGHSVYLRFTDTTTNNALTTIGGFDMGRIVGPFINLPQLASCCILVEVHLRMNGYGFTMIHLSLIL